MGIGKAVLIPKQVGKEGDSSLRLRMTRVSWFVAPIILFSTCGNPANPLRMVSYKTKRLFTSLRWTNTKK